MRGYEAVENLAVRSGSMMKFLRTFLARLRSWFATLTPANTASPSDLGAQEMVSRFIYTEKNIKKSEKRPRPNAFEPPPDDRQLSTAHSTDLSNNSIWLLARMTLGPNRRKVFARADLFVRDLIEQGLRAIRDDNPFERHTIVIGWPDSPDADERKAKTKEICLALCHAPSMNLVLPLEDIVWSPPEGTA
jgi:hypothetical protein